MDVGHLDSDLRALRHSGVEVTWPNYADIGIGAEVAAWIPASEPRRHLVQEGQIMVKAKPLTDPPPWSAGQRIPFEGGYWLVEWVQFDGEHGWRFEVVPIMSVECSECGHKHYGDDYCDVRLCSEPCACACPCSALQLQLPWAPDAA